jgi:hypothetical protein
MSLAVRPLASGPLDGPAAVATNTEATKSRKSARRTHLASRVSLGTVRRAGPPYSWGNRLLAATDPIVNCPPQQL